MEISYEFYLEVISILSIHGPCCKVALIFQLGVSVQFRSGHGRARIQLAHPVPCKNSAYQQEGIPWDSNLNRNVLVIVLLVGGLEHFLFSHILGIIIPID